MTANDDRPINDWFLALAMHLAGRPVQILVALIAAAGVLWVSPWIALSGLLTLAWLEGFPRPKDDAYELTAEDEPALFAMVTTLADTLGVTTPFRVRIVTELDASIHRRRQRGGPVNIVDLGWPLVMTTPERELSAVLAHELAHDRDLGAPHRFVHSARMRLVHSRRVPVIGSLLLRMTQADFHEREYRADAVAATVVGATTVAAALHRTMQLEAVFETIVEHWTEVMAGEGEYPSDLFDVLPVVLEDPAVLAWLDRGIVRSMLFDRLEDIDAPHPSYETRLQRLGVEPAAVKRDGGPAVPMTRTLELSRWAVTTGFDVESDDERRPGLIAGSAIGRFDFDPSSAQGDLKAATSEPLLRSALQRVGETIDAGDWQTLAEKLDPELVDVPPAIREEAAKTVLVNCVATSLITPLLQAGGSRANRWIQGLVQTRGGDEVNVFLTVETAIEANDATQLRALIDMAEVGVGA